MLYKLILMNIVVINLSNLTTIEMTLMDCYSYETNPILKYAASFKPYFYPFIIEFRVITPAMFCIMWSRIDHLGANHLTRERWLIVNNIVTKKLHSNNENQMVFIYGTF
jgi:hypothetical protein